MKVDPNENSPEYKKGESLIWKMLAQSVLQKIIHGKGLTHSLHCGTLLDMSENEGKDAEPGTIGELLRYGSVHFEQTREMEYIEAPAVKADVIIRKGLLEP
ncbi:Capsule polysaccharide biosynthesis protein [Pyrenophora teres f. maculata]|nr:Capsule polysaccharide biosynthesis protein [Pyrenophora teres f. maculata]